MSDINYTFDEILFKYCNDPTGFYIDAEANGKYDHLDYKHFANVFNEWVNNTVLTPDELMESMMVWDPESSDILMEIATGIKDINDGYIKVTESVDFFESEILPDINQYELYDYWGCNIDGIVEDFIDGGNFDSRDLTCYEGYVIEYPF